MLLLLDPRPAPSHRWSSWHWLWLPSSWSWSALPRASPAKLSALTWTDGWCQPASALEQPVWPMPKEPRWPSPGRRSAGRSATSRSKSTAGGATAASSAPADGPPAWPGTPAASRGGAGAAAVALLDGSIASCAAHRAAVEQCLAGRRRAALIQGTAVVAAHVVILAAIVVLAWPLSQPATPAARQGAAERAR
jgi:hypothetical protein